MKRLTKKTGAGYVYNYDKNCDSDEREKRMLETHNAIVNKLGVVEDIEEELGIDLVKLLKASQCCFVRDLEGSIHKGKLAKIDLTGGVEIMLLDMSGSLRFNKEGLMINLSFMKMSERKKIKWALTKEEL